MRSRARQHGIAPATPKRGDIYSRRRQGRVEWWCVAYLLSKGDDTYAFLHRVDDQRKQTIATLHELADEALFERVEAHLRDAARGEKPS
jgi:hypothetical protein